MRPPVHGAMNPALWKSPPRVANISLRMPGLPAAFARQCTTPSLSRPVQCGCFHQRPQLPHQWRPNVKPAVRPAPPAAAASTAAASQAAEADDAGSTDSGRNQALRLAWAVLRPDWPLLLLTGVMLMATVFVTLAFPLVIGDLFDVVRAQLGGATATPAASSATTTFSGTLAALRSSIAAAPPEFAPVLLRLCSFLVASAFGNATVAYLSPLMAERFAARLRQRLMREMLSQRQPFFDAMAKGNLVARLTLDVTVLQSTLADLVGQRGVRSMLEVIFSLAIITAKNPILAVISFVITPTLSRLLRSVVVKSAGLTLQRQAAAARALEFATERLTHVRSVQVFDQEEREAQAYRGLSEEGYRLAVGCARFQGMVEGAGRLAVNIGTLSLLGLGGVLVLQGRISLGTLLAANVYNLFLSVGLASVAASLGEIGKAVGSLERIAEVAGSQKRDPAAVELFERQQETTTSAKEDSHSATGSASRAAHSDPATTSTVGSVSSSGQSAPGSTTRVAPTAAAALLEGVQLTAGARVEFQDVWFQYERQTEWALRGLNLTVPSGDTVALVGPSGGGKSTAAALLLGLYSAQKGQILVDGVTLSDATIAGVRAQTGAVLQRPTLMSGTVADQIRFGRPDASQEEVEIAAAGANADAFIAALPAGYGTEVGERGHSLSGGQKQRIAIARALARQPRLLLLDEPTAALDVQSERAVDDALRLLPACTKVIIAHRLSTVRQADRIVVLREGRAVEEGSHDELMGVQGGEYRRMVLTAELGGVEAAADSDQPIQVAALT